MKIGNLLKEADLDRTGREMHDLMAELYPLPRSITGEGFRQTMRTLKKNIPLEIHEVPTGTQVLDWSVPKEWNIRDAYVKNSKGERIIDFKESNLHVVGYSVPIHTTMGLAELKEHLHSLPDHPDWIPYRTSYYNEGWGFCLSHRELEALPDDTYEVRIDSDLRDGSLTYGELFIPGETEEEVLLSCHACHPSLCNDNLSGVVLCTALGKLLRSTTPRYSYRILFVPGTIGSITWLALHEDVLPRIRHGLVVACVGDPGRMTYKRSRRGKATIDRAVEHVLKHSGQDFEILDFSPYGYDERQYCSPGFNLPVGSLTRTPHGRFPQYHTSADDLNFVRPEYLADSLSKYLRVLNVLENDRTYINTSPKGEPQLGRRGLYKRIGGQGGGPPEEQMALLWVLNLSDGDHSLLDIAERSGLPFEKVLTASEELMRVGLLREGGEKAS